MITNHAKVLKQLHEYVCDYIDYAGTRPEASLAEANEELKKIIGELEELQAHPDQPAEAAHVSTRLADQLRHLQLQLERTEHRRQRAQPSHQKRTLAQAFSDYLCTEVDYLMKAGGGTRREQTNLLLGDVIADLKALALHPTDEQALQLAADLECKRAQLQKLERPWQQVTAKR